AVDVAEHGGPGSAALRPIAAVAVLAGSEGGAVHLRAGERVVLVGRITAALDERALLIEGGLLGEVGRAVQIVDLLGNHDALGVLPGTASDAVLGVDGSR